MTFSYRNLAVKITGIGGIIVKQNVFMPYLILVHFFHAEESLHSFRNSKGYSTGCRTDHDRHKNHDPFMWMPCKGRNRSRPPPAHTHRVAQNYFQREFDIVLASRISDCRLMAQVRQSKWVLFCCSPAIPNFSKFQRKDSSVVFELFLNLNKGNDTVC